MTPASIGIDLGATHVRAAINDARAAALAEACLVVTVGTGIGGGLVINGRLHTGTGHSGEIGHILIDPHAPPCRCDEADAHPEGPTASAAAGRQPNVAGLVRAAATSDSAAIDTIQRYAYLFARGLRQPGRQQRLEPALARPVSARLRPWSTGAPSRPAARSK
jgi:predicted NBD/HSP70 family sugar kinase